MGRKDDVYGVVEFLWGDCEPVRTLSHGAQEAGAVGGTGTQEAKVASKVK